jgi:hypothetical protein
MVSYIAKYLSICLKGVKTETSKNLILEVLEDIVDFASYVWGPRLSELDPGAGSQAQDFTLFTSEYPGIAIKRRYLHHLL